MCGEVVAVKVSFSSQRCLLVGNLRDSHNMQPHPGQPWKKSYRAQTSKTLKLKASQGLLWLTPPLPIAQSLGLRFKMVRGRIRTVGLFVERKLVASERRERRSKRDLSSIQKYLAHNCKSAKERLTYMVTQTFRETMDFLPVVRG